MSKDELSTHKMRPEIRVGRWHRALLPLKTLGRVFPELAPDDLDLCMYYSNTYFHLDGPLPPCPSTLLPSLSPFVDRVLLCSSG